MCVCARNRLNTNDNSPGKEEDGEDGEDNDDATKTTVLHDKPLIALLVRLIAWSAVSLSTGPKDGRCLSSSQPTDRRLMAVKHTTPLRLAG